MYLQRESFLSIEQFDQQGKPRRLWNVAENIMFAAGRIRPSGGSMLCPKFVQRFAAKRSVRDDTLRFGSINDFPRFADAGIRRQLLPELRLETASAPHSFHENRREGEGSCHCRWRIVDCRLANAKDTVV